MMAEPSDTLISPTDDPRYHALLAGMLQDPFSYLGPRRNAEKLIVRCFYPDAKAVEVVARRDGSPLGQLTPIGDEGVFEGVVTCDLPYRLHVHWPTTTLETEDPYSFKLILGELDLHLFSEGTHWKLAERFGSAVTELEDIPGVRFAVWAPNAMRVSVVGDFNMWDGRRHPMRLRHDAGVWELFIPRLGPGERYKYEIVGADGTVSPQRADPLARATERPPATASIVPQPFQMRWTDADWMQIRSGQNARSAAISIYEVHAGSWLRPDGSPDRILDWKSLAQKLIPYVCDLGFTHIELLPIMEHPFGGSWGYQPLSLFAPSARFGEPCEFAHFVDVCHKSGIGVILDWVPGHFPNDPHGLVRFDGTALYEHADPREGHHQDWNTLIYNYGRTEVQGFLIASALYWLETFHIDGLRVDAVASMLYRDYSRQEGQWRPNRFGGRENLEAIDFLKRLNAVVAERAPGAITIAEESTAWPGVSRSLADGGLGFSYKWNMGWMHDTLIYMGKDPAHRKWHHNEFTFSMIYAYSEHYVLPLSHDEVVHGKSSLYGRMPGDAWQKLANLRCYFTFMWTHPGKKLLFMGGEIGQDREWSHDSEVDWGLLANIGHAGLQKFVRDLNRLYVKSPQLHAQDDNPSGFSWVIGDDSDNSVFSYARHAPGMPSLLIVLNMTPVPRHDYRVGVDRPGRWRELLNSDAALYGGSNIGNAGQVQADAMPAHGQKFSLSLTLPPLGAMILAPED